MAPQILIQQFLDATETAIEFGEKSEQAYEAHTKITQSRIRIYGLILSKGFKKEYTRALDRICDIDEKFVNECIDGLKRYHDLLMRADMWLEVYQDAETAKEQRAIIHNLNTQISIYQRLLYTASTRILKDRELCKTNNPLMLKEALKTFSEEHELIETTHMSQYEPEKVALVQRDLIGKTIEKPMGSIGMTVGAAAAGGVASYAAATKIAHYVSDALWQLSIGDESPSAFLKILKYIFTTSHDGGMYSVDDPRRLALVAVTGIGLMVGGMVAYLITKRRNLRKKLKMEAEAHIERLEGELENIRPKALIEKAEKIEENNKELDRMMA